MGSSIAGIIWAVIHVFLFVAIAACESPSYELRISAQFEPPARTEPWASFNIDGDKHQDSVRQGKGPVITSLKRGKHRVNIDKDAYSGVPYATFVERYKFSTWLELGHSNSYFEVDLQQNTHLVAVYKPVYIFSADRYYVAIGSPTTLHVVTGAPEEEIRILEGECNNRSETFAVGTAKDGTFTLKWTPKETGSYTFALWGPRFQTQQNETPCVTIRVGKIPELKLRVAPVGRVGEPIKIEAQSEAEGRMYLYVDEQRLDSSPPTTNMSLFWSPTKAGLYRIRAEVNPTSVHYIANNAYTQVEVK